MNLFSKQLLIYFFSYQLNQQEVLDIPITLRSIDLFKSQLDTARENWRQWEAANLATISPNLAPTITHPEQLKEQGYINENIYKVFTTFINGKHTLLDLSVKMDQNILLLIKSLIPYIRKGIIKLIEVPDLSITLAEKKSSTLPSIPNKLREKNRPLIIGIDDSPQVCKILEKILTDAGYRFIGIQDSIQALGSLIENQPDLIFLDLIMPVANGYELCSQIRRVSLLAKTPVIILTGSDGLVDRVRAKMVGATNFMSKPINKGKLLAIVEKYIQTKA